MEELKTIRDTLERMVQKVEENTIKDRYSDGYLNGIKWAKSLVDIAIKVKEK